MTGLQTGQQEPTLVQWPEPAHLQLQQNQSLAMPCEIEYADGAKATGTLIYFTGRDDYLKLQTDADGAEQIDLAAIKQIHLPEPVPAKPYEIELDANGNATPAPTQIYNVEFNDGEILSGETSGYVSMPNGIFLYSQAEPESLRRSFIPHGAIAYFQAGDPMGKLLVEENAVSEESLQQAVEKQQVMRKQLLGDYLISEAYITHEQLEQAMQLQKTKTSLRLGEALIEMGALTTAALEAALARQRSNRSRPLSQILIEMGVLDQQTLQKVHDKKKGLPSVNLSNFQIDPKVRKRIAEAAARSYGVIPLALEDDALIVAFSSTPDPAILNELAAMAGQRVVAVMATTEEISIKQDALYAIGHAADDLFGDDDLLAAPEAPPVNAVSDAAVDRLFEQGQAIELSEQVELASEHVLLMVTQRMLAEALNGGSLEIKIESEGKQRRTHIRFSKGSKA